MVLQEVLFQENTVASDGEPTDISTITVYATGTLALNNRIDKLSLAVDTNDNGYYDAGDAIIAYRTLPFNNPGLPPLHVTFGVPGTLLLRVPDQESARVFVIADIAITALTGESITTCVEATAEDDLCLVGETNSGVSSDFVTGFPVCSSYCTVVAFATGDVETNLIDETQVCSVANGENRVVVQEFVISDPNTGIDVTPDGHPTWINSLVVRRTAGSTIEEDDITQMWIVVESDGTPGLSFWDEVVSGPVAVAGEGIDMVHDGIMFDNPCPGASPFLDMNPTTPFRDPVWDQQQVRLYVLADFEGTLVDGDWLKLETTVYASDGYCPVVGVSSDFENPMLMASNPVVVGGATATIDVGDVDLGGTTGFVTISIDALLIPGLGEMQVGDNGGTGGAFTFDKDVINIISVEGVAPYVVLSFTDPATANADEELRFTVSYDASLGMSPITSGAIARIEVEGAPGADVGDSCTLVITQVDVLRDVNGVDIPVLAILPGTATITVSQGNKGDVNNDGTVDITDARWVAEYAIGSRTLTPGELARADVAPPYIPPDSNVDITDARYIAEAAIGLRTLSLMAAKVGPMAVATRAQLAINVNGQLVVSGSSAELADLQGKLLFNPAVLSVTEVIGVNGFTVLASSIDNAAGEVRFAAANFSGRMVVEGPVVEFVIVGDATKAVADIEILRDVHALDVPFEFLTSVKGELLSFGNYPNPVEGVHTTTFSVKGTLPVDEMRVEIYNFSGKLVYDSGWGPNDLDWHLQNDAGDVLANGVYYYRILVRFIGQDKPVVSGLQKLAIYR